MRTHNAWFNNRSECSLNRRISGKLARCPPGFMVKSRGWFVICATEKGSQSDPRAGRLRKGPGLLFTAHLVLVLFCRGEVEQAVDFVIGHVFRLDVCGVARRDTVRNPKFFLVTETETGIGSLCSPSSSSPRYLSKMGSSLMASTAARFVVRFRLNSFDWK